MISLAWQLQVEAKHTVEVRRALAAVVGGVASGCGGGIGWVRIVPGEEPVLLALAPRIDLVAEQVTTALGGPSAHHLWLELEPARYLGEVIDPYRAFGGSDAELEALLGSGGVRCILAIRTGSSKEGQRLELVLHGTRASLRRIVGAARPYLATLRALLAASTNVAAAPKPRVKSML